MVQAFQDRQNLYLVMEHHTGGDLRYHLVQRALFSEQQTKFFVACILRGLEFMHQRQIIHRDIKPENLIFDTDGYLRITDLGIAKVWTNNVSLADELSGTPGYMAPEVMFRMNHSYSVDFYAIGIIAYECMLGRRPYNGRHRKEIRDSILAK